MPYGDIEKEYDRSANELLEKGISRSQMRDYAPYTVTVPVNQVDSIAEPVCLSKRRKKTETSGYYVLLPQNRECYEKDMGLQIKQSNPETFFL